MRRERRLKTKWTKWWPTTTPWSRVRSWRKYFFVQFRIKIIIIKIWSPQQVCSFNNFDVIKIFKCFLFRSQISEYETEAQGKMDSIESELKKNSRNFRTNGEMRRKISVKYITSFCKVFKEFCHRNAKLDAGQISNLGVGIENRSSARNRKSISEIDGSYSSRISFRDLKIRIQSTWITVNLKF